MPNRDTADTENESGDKVENSKEKFNLKGDYGNIAILLLLYMLQGIPLGISSAVPILLQNRGVSYSEQAGFTFAYYPYTMKILWAPIVDSVYIKWFGRRKSWLVPAQFILGVFMLFVAHNVDEWMGGSGNGPQMVLLTSIFFVMWFLAATQDIAVDGWALTMLKREHVGFAATCNAVGITAGGFLGYVVFLVLESKEFANKYVFSEPREEGLITLAGFLQFWGVVFLGVTLLIAIFKRESPDAAGELEANPDYGIAKAYPILWKVLNVKPIIKFALILLTAKASFAACDAVTTLKLIDYGIPKDKIALLSIPLVPLQILLPFFISRFTTGPHPMTFYIKSFPFRLIMTIVIAAFVYATPSIIVNDGTSKTIPTYFYVIMVTIYMIYQVPLRGMFVAEMAFMSRISDPLVGGTYMTLLNTISNLGGRWVKTFFLWLVDVITWQACIADEFYQGNVTFTLTDNKCADKVEKSECITNGGTCRIDVDGYYIEVALNVIYGVIWYQWGKRVLTYLQDVPRHEWHVLSKPPKDEEDIPLSVVSDSTKN
ncbi:hypothetical protein HA402_007799 [Bradysia odoriphaga]|nr:hypothetical protein HA402_007799 [Bradysia odoriphaga]